MVTMSYLKPFPR